MRHRQPVSTKSAVRPYFSPAAPRILAHRGLSSDAPENTVLAFVRALAAGAEYLETDVQVSRDGVAVIAHDADLSRVAGRATRVDELTFQELRKIDLGHGQVFSSLAEVLESFPDARFNIDIKATGAVAPAVEAILDARAVGRVLIASFSGRRRRATVKLLPQVATSASSGLSAWAVVAGRLGVSPLAGFALRHVDAVQLPHAVKGIRIVTARLVRTLHRAGVEVHVWTVNDVPTMLHLLGIGVDAIVTDRADLALGAVVQHGSAQHGSAQNESAQNGSPRNRRISTD